VIGTSLAHYRITAVIGAGGMGEVYRATDTRLGRDVAIKVLPGDLAQDAERLARFEREAKLLASLNHPSIAHVYGFESATLDGGSPAHFLAMELVEGEDLAERLKRGPIPVDEALAIARQVAEALEEAHDRGIVHRDLKPANVKVTEDGKVKVLDFGLAKAYAGGSAASSGPDLSQSPTLAHTGTQAGVILGTAAYMSPEQARGKAVDKRADVWAFGVVLYEMLTGKRLFTGETASDVLAGVLKTEIDFAVLPAATSPAIRRLLRECLERNPRNRLHDIGDARLVLEDSLAGRGDESLAVAPARGAKGAMLRTAVVAAGALAIGLAVGHLVTKGAGEPRVSFERLTFRPGHFANARFAPDGETVFLSADWERSEREVFQVRPKAGELALGLVGAELLSVSRSGELAVLLPRSETGNPYVQSGTLAVVSASGGTPRKLADGVLGADWAPDGQSLAVLRVAEGKRRLEYPLGTLLYASPNEIYCIRVSPKGDEVAFFEHDDKGEVAVAVVDRSGVRRVWSGGWPDWWLLAWSPAGDEIWFGASVGGNASNLYAVDRRGHLRTLLAAPGLLELHDAARGGGILAAQVQATNQVFGGRVGEASERNLSWLEDSRVADLSSDGTLALLSVLSEREAGFGVYLRSMDGSPPVRLGSGRAKELSRNGRWALALRDDALVALPTAEGQERLLATGFSRLTEARWLPDGLHVLVAGTDPDGSTRLKLVGFDGGPTRTVVERLELRAAAALNTRLLSPVSPDGRFVAAAMASGEIAILSLDGGAARALPGSGPNDLPVQWSADGRRLFLLDPSGLPAKVYAVEMASGRRELWRELMPVDRAGVSGVEAVALTPDATAYSYSYRQYRSVLYLLKGLR
jgi:dipeptidyl aminopeptidase/acylaminoacyl peptidase